VQRGLHGRQGRGGLQDAGRCSCNIAFAWAKRRQIGRRAQVDLFVFTRLATLVLGQKMVRIRNVWQRMVVGQQAALRTGLHGQVAVGTTGDLPRRLWFEHLHGVGQVALVWLLWPYWTSCIGVQHGIGAACQHGSSTQEKSTRNAASSACHGWASLHLAAAPGSLFTVG
jgi:hypothetical protein